MTRSKMSPAATPGLAAFALALAAAVAPAQAQTTVSADFTQSGAITKDSPAMSWIATGGACLTAVPSGHSINGIPSCIGLPYYVNGTLTSSSVINGAGQPQVGGYNYFLGDSSAPSSNGAQDPDPATDANGIGYGALRLTNGKDQIGNNTYLYQHGAIVSASSFSAANGIEIVFKAIAYSGNGSGGTGSGQDGADGMSFFLIDATKWNAVYPSYPSGYPEAGPTGDLQATWPAIGATGGALGYSCSNGNHVNDGMVGAYIGLGIDEYGNYLNGGASNDNTATGVAASGWGSGNYQWNRIGLRGNGNVNWLELNKYFSHYYPNSLTMGDGGQRQAAVWNTCKTGTIWDYSNPSSPSDTHTTVQSGNTLGDYAVISGANGTIPLSGSHAQQLASESARKRSQATPIFYRLKITGDGKLTFSYSYSGYSQQVLSGVDISGTNGALPANLYFGFAGSTGGSDNVHEILCFKALPSDQSDSSATVSVPEDKVITDVQVYVPSYHTNNWWGELTAYSFSYSTNQLSLTTPPNWDASCVLTGGACTSWPTLAGTPSLSGTNGAQPWQSSSTNGRQILSWNDSTNAGVALQWGNLSNGEKQNLDASAYSASASSSTVLNYLRGDRSNELSNGGTLRVRNSVLGDIIQSSPMVTSLPSETYPAVWSDNLYSSASPAENGGSATTYPTYVSNNVQRQNIVYVGANDGLLHAFRAGSFNANGSFNQTNNDGLEVLAYMPAQVVNNINTAYDPGDNYPSTNYAHSYFVDAPPVADDLFYQNAWHTWLVGGLGAGGPSLYALDITDPTQFSESHASSLVLGEWNASTINAHCASGNTCGNYLQDTYGKPVIWRMHNGSWAVMFGNGQATPIPITAHIDNGNASPSSGSVLTVTNGAFLQVGQWVLGAGVPAGTKITAVNTAAGTYTLNNSALVASESMNAYSINASGNGNAGVYIMTIDPVNGPSSTGTKFYFLDTGYGPSRDPQLVTGQQGRPNGIAYVSPVDLDGDNVVDYIYAGDVFGNLWRFDVTCDVASGHSGVCNAWGASKYNNSVATPLYSTYSGTQTTYQPITSKPLVSVTSMGSGHYGVIVNFGTGQEVPLSLSTSPLASYAGTGQAMYGIWDWDMSAWNTHGPVQTLAAITDGSAHLGSYGNLQQQSETMVTNTVNGVSSNYAVVSTNTVNWCFATPCTGGQYGWVLPLTLQTGEQIIYNPTLGVSGILQFNTVIPPSNTIYSCNDSTPTGFSMFINPTTGSAFSTSPLKDGNGNVLTTSAGQVVSGIQTNGTGAIIDITTNGQTFAASSNATGGFNTNLMNPVGPVVGHRVTWTELR